LTKNQSTAARIRLCDRLVIIFRKLEVPKIMSVNRNQKNPAVAGENALQLVLLQYRFLRSSTVSFERMYANSYYYCRRKMSFLTSGTINSNKSEIAILWRRCVFRNRRFYKRITLYVYRVCILYDTLYYMMIFKNKIR